LAELRSGVIDERTAASTVTEAFAVAVDEDAVAEVEGVFFFLLLLLLFLLFLLEGV
jgi:hypothetical protein